MAKMSISRAWDETKDVLRRDGRLLLPIALAFMVLPAALLGLVMPGPEPQVRPGLALLFMLVIAAIGFVGQMAVQWLALHRETRVSDAIRKGARATPILLLAIVLLMLPLALLMAPFAGTLTSGNQEEMAKASLAILVGGALALFVLVRFLLVSPVAVAEGKGPLAVLKRSWQLTRGNTLKLYGTLLLFFLALGAISWAVTASVGSAAILLLGRPEPWSLSALLISLSTQLAQLVLALPFAIIVARLYAQATRHEHEPASVPDAP